MRPRARLYTLLLSHPGHAVRLMLERKRIDHDVTYLLAGFHPVTLRARRFRGATTPALTVDGRRIQGSRAIAAALDEIQPEPALFPADPAARRNVVEAEAWGEAELQPVPRRLLRWGFKNDDSMLRWELEGELERLGLGRMPGSALMARTTTPVALYFARISGSTDAAIRADLAALPGLLEHVEHYIDAGTIGGQEPNAADFQIGTTVRLLYAFDDLRSLVEGTKAGDLAMRIFPDFRHRVPRFLPRDWIQPRRAPGLRADPSAAR